MGKAPRPKGETKPASHLREKRRAGGTGKRAAPERKLKKKRHELSREKNGPRNGEEAVLKTGIREGGQLRTLSRTGQWVAGEKLH